MKSHDEARTDARTRVLVSREVGDRSVMSQYVMSSNIPTERSHRALRKGVRVSAGR